MTPNVHASDHFGHNLVDVYDVIVGKVGSNARQVVSRDQNHNTGHIVIYQFFNLCSSSSSSDGGDGGGVYVYRITTVDYITYILL